MDLSLSIALGSSLQIALFVAPVLVFVSLAMGHPLTLEFNNYEVIALFAASLVAAFVALDGRSNWLEGAMLWPSMASWPSASTSCPPRSTSTLQHAMSRGRSNVPGTLLSVPATLRP